MTEVTQIPHIVDKLSVVYGLIVYGGKRIKFTADKTFYLAKFNAEDENDPDKMVTVGWLSADEYRALKDAKLVSEEDVVR